MNRFLSPQTLDRFLEQTAEALPDASAFSPDTNSLSKVWTQEGLRPGDVVLLCLPNGRELLHHFFGVLMAGGVPALLAPSTPVTRVCEVGAAMGARAIARFYRPFSIADADKCFRIGILHVTFLPATAEPAASPGEVILLTSGTSGFSSGCVFDLEAILLNGQRHARAIGQEPQDTVLVNLPLSFSFALSSQALSSLVCGNKLVISGPPFHPETFARNITAYGITIASLTPIIIRNLLSSKGGAQSSVAWPRVLSVGGDSLEPELVKKLIEVRAGREVYLTYGLTQAGPRVSTLAAHDAPEWRYSSVGLPLDGTQVELRSTGDDTPLQQLYVTSQTVMKRPIGRVEGRIQHDLVSPGTIATGDAFRVDTEGNLYFLGRLSEFICRDGEKVSLATVRGVAARLPHVTRAKTQVVSRTGGGDDYDLDLFIEDSVFEKGTPFDARKAMSSYLKRAEMPRQIRIWPSREATQEGYK